MEEEKKDFVVKDRRIFSQDKAEETPRESPEAQKKPAQPDRTEQKEQREPPAAGKRKAETRLPEINFQTFIFSLNASALVQLGLMEDPGTGKNEKNLPLAKQTIDLLSMIEEKTTGNLSKEEGEMLKHVLYDLRIRYVKEKG